MSDLQYVIEAYRALLAIPMHISVRTDAQRAMAACRDYIAEHTRMDAEQVQNAFELTSYAHHMGKLNQKLGGYE